VLAVGAGTVGDIYRPTERANAMGYYYTGVSRDGLSMAPLTLSLGLDWARVQSPHSWLVHRVHRREHAPP
jgi:hypothetical protein